MSDNDLDLLLDKMDDIAKAVNSFNSESVQKAAFDSLISAFFGTLGSRAAKPSISEEAAVESGEPAEQNGKKPRRPQRKSRVQGAKTERGSGFDEGGLLNAMKNDARFQTFRDKIIVGSATKIEQVKFVSWYAGEVPMTSGNMRRVLDGLGVRMSPPQASDAVTSAKSDFIATSPPTKPQTFRLSAPAHAAFEKWLLNDTAAS